MAGNPHSVEYSLAINRCHVWQNMTPFPPSPLLPANRMSIRLKDLHSLYQTVSHDEAIAIANLGAQTYLAAKEGLFEAWNAAQGVEEGERTERWRREGGEAMLASLKARLAAGEAAAARVATLQASIEAEVAGRIDQMLVTQRKDFELAKMEEIRSIEKKLAAAEAREEMSVLLKESHATMREKITVLEAQVAERNTTKSSHAIGKEGEATVLEMLQTNVLQEFQFSEVKDMTSIHHSADFHLKVMGSDGKKFKILIDSKKYKNSIQATEVIKLNSDVDADEEARAGLLISHDSSIQTKRQFSIHRTEKNKPVMCMTFQDLTDETKRMALCWAVRVLQSIAIETNLDEKIKMINGLNDLLRSLERSVKKIDIVIRMETKTLEAMREVRNELIHKITAFRKGGEIVDDEEDLVIHEVEMDAGCNSILKKTGTQCGRTISTEGKCKIHCLRTAKK